MSVQLIVGLAEGRSVHLCLRKKCLWAYYEGMHKIHDKSLRNGVLSSTNPLIPITTMQLVLVHLVEHIEMPAMLELRSGPSAQVFFVTLNHLHCGSLTSYP